MPFVIKAGKALDERKVEVRIRFNAVAGAVKSVSRCAPNELIVRVQPDESIYWKVQSKAPGLDFHIEQQLRRRSRAALKVDQRVQKAGCEDPESWC